jgi:hypothetical protein
MNPRLAFSLLFLSAISGAPPAEAGVYSCNLPRALLCADCARDLTFTLAANGACRVSFTPGGESSTRAQTVHFVVLTPSATPWRPHFSRRPAPAGVGSSGRCFLFNGNQYCE